MGQKRHYDKGEIHAPRSRSPTGVAQRSESMLTHSGVKSRSLWMPAWCSTAAHALSHAFHREQAGFAGR